MYAADAVVQEAQESVDTPANTHGLLQEELRHEEHMVDWGIRNYRKSVEKQVEKDRGAETKPALRLTERLVPIMAKAVSECFDDANSGKPGRRHAAVKYLNMLADVLGSQDEACLMVSFLTIQQCFVGAFATNQTLQLICRKLGERVENEVRFQTWRRADDGGLAAYYNLMAFTPSRLGVELAATPANFAEETALFMKKWTGEVLSAFETRCVMNTLMDTRNIDSGASAKFDALGEATASYHTPGQNRLDALQSIKHDDFVINVDHFLVADLAIHEWDEAVNHYEVRSRYTKKLAKALAKQYDVTALQLGVLGARMASRIPDGDGGTRLFDATYATDDAALVAAIFAAAEAMDDKDIDEEGRKLLVRPSEYYRLVQTNDCIDRDYGGEGSIAKGSIKELAGFEIVKTNHLPSTDLSGASTTGQNNTYVGNFADTLGLCLTPDALGTVKLKDLSVGAEYKMELLSTYCQAKYALGHGVLRPECLLEISKAAA